MIDLLGPMRRKGLLAARRPAGHPPDVRQPADSRNDMPELDGSASDGTTSDSGCDPYNSGMFNRADSWSRVNKRS